MKPLREHKAKYCLLQSIHVSFICNVVSIHALICAIQAPEQLSYATTWLEADKFSKAILIQFVMQSMLCGYGAM